MGKTWGLAGADLELRSPSGVSGQEFSGGRSSDSPESELPHFFILAQEAACGQIPKSGLFPAQGLYNIVPTCPPCKGPFEAGHPRGPTATILQPPRMGAFRSAVPPTPENLAAVSWASASRGGQAPSSEPAGSERFGWATPLLWASVASSADWGQYHCSASLQDQNKGNSGNGCLWLSFREKLRDEDSSAPKSCVICIPGNGVSGRDLPLHTAHALQGHVSLSSTLYSHALSFLSGHGNH